ncbi:EAL domain-containing protein [Rhizobiaceae bacterium BDR2-2]|uniref:EAL domain-containing protein n=1 Tax=Ectorhizobium quercum TaxID=2965071 RepID=A0AAE3SWJ8_9HYPH|nr:EAL domain-containing protein [Ectorhizobium quercum]MCX8997510.1 EAL domain-containing protein [Ectorhizobium quercum]
MAAPLRRRQSTLRVITAGRKNSVCKLLEVAIQQGQVWPGFQPIIDIRSGKVAGFEVLARWSDPQDGDISPLTFIAPLERLGLLDLLSDALMEQACLAAVNWPGEFFLAFNISPLQLASRNLPQHIADVVRRTGFPIGRVQVEITESSLMADAKSGHGILHELDALGVRIAIDDFGTGYSNLARLEAFPFHKLKIDRRFVHLIDREPAKRRIAAAIIGLGQSLGITVVAEGVETKEEEATLREFGCDLGQGWLYGKALNAAGAGQFLETVGNRSVQTRTLDISPFQRLHQLAALYKQAPVGLCFIDLDFRHVSANNRFASMHGLSAAELEGKTIHEVMEPVAADIAVQLLRNSMETGASAQHQYHFQGRDVLVFNTRVTDVDDAVIGFSLVSIDNTEQMRALNALADREEHYRYVTELNPHIEWAATPDGIFDYISPSSEDLPGDTMRQRIERWQRRIHPEDFPRLKEKWFSWITSDEPYKEEFRFIQPDGSFRHVCSYAIAAKWPDGRIKRWYGITKDIPVLPSDT